MYHLSGAQTQKDDETEIMTGQEISDVEWLAEQKCTGPGTVDEEYEYHPCGCEPCDARHWIKQCNGPESIMETIPNWFRHIAILYRKNSELQVQLDRINTPEIMNFLAAVDTEAKHQRIEWEANGDAGKTDPDWFWLLGYLGGKALNPGRLEKQLHHIITTAAACLNWPAARVGTYTTMRPGIGASEETNGTATD